MKPVPALDEDIAHALRAIPAAQAKFAAFPPSHQAEYINWIAEAKKPVTRARRIAQMVQKLTDS